MFCMHLLVHGTRMLRAGDRRWDRHDLPQLAALLQGRPALASVICFLLHTAMCCVFATLPLSLLSTKYQ